jgi:glycosyltransferase involved in cell wall biosynthesis
MQTKDCIAIVSPTYSSYSETFIANHAKYLPGSKIAIYSFGHDARFENGATLLKMDKLSRLLRFCERKLRKVNLLDQETEALMKLFKRKKVSCVLAEYGTTGAKLTQACQKNNLPLVVHFHGYDASRIDILEKYKVLYQQMFSSSKAIIAVSSPMKKKLLSLGADDNKVKCISCGIDLSKFKPINKGFSYDFLAVGRFVEKKAPYLTILAFSQVVKTIPDARLLMVGDGPLRSICKQLAGSLNIRDKVEFRGVLNNEEVAQLMKRVFCFVQHSLTAESGDTEGTPVAILEASASALPVISTKHAGILDAVKHEETGFLVEEGDVNGMAEYMIRLVKKPNEAKRLGLNGRKWIATNYDIKSRIADLWAVLQN